MEKANKFRSNQNNIRDCLMHLPEKSYPDNEIELNTMKVYQHIFSSYFGGNKSIYQEYN